MNTFISMRNIKIIKRKDIKHEKYIETLTSILRKKKRELFESR